MNEPSQKCTIDIPDLGTISGWQYENGVCQFLGIPYATLSKRWTRSELRTSLDDDYHDGTKLGARCPHPEVEGDDTDVLTPVPPFPHCPYPEVDEQAALVVNVVVPPEHVQGKHPIFVNVHGGSLLYGGSYLAIFDAVRLVSQSVDEGKPIVAVNFNYRVGLGGFLASKAIREELLRDGFEGCGNFGFTDQQVAFEWIQRYAGHLGGDVENVTAVGESAGGISISNQLLAKTPPTFHRAVCMSGLATSIPAWTSDQHEELFAAVCQWYHLDPKGPDTLDKLRQIPQQDLANATPSISGALSGTGNPCLDGWFYQNDPRGFHIAPRWLNSYMLGDVYHEGVIFHLNIMDDTFDLWRKIFVQHISDEDVVDSILELYGISREIPHEKLLENFEHMAGDAIFRIPNIVTAQHNQNLAEKGNLFLYHFDQRSKIPNILEGTAYHAYELLYLFKNLDDEMDEEERRLSKDFASAWIAFTHGEQPWGASCPSLKDRQWKLWGPNGKQAVVLEVEDEEVRRYSRIEKMLKVGEAGVTWRKWLDAIDAIVNKRWRLGTIQPSL